MPYDRRNEYSFLIVSNINFCLRHTNAQFEFIIIYLLPNDEYKRNKNEIRTRASARARAPRESDTYISKLKSFAYWCFGNLLFFLLSFSFDCVRQSNWCKQQANMSKYIYLCVSSGAYCVECKTLIAAEKTEVSNRTHIVHFFLLVSSFALSRSTSFSASRSSLFLSVTNDHPSYYTVFLRTHHR